MSVFIPGAAGLFLKGAVAWFKGPWGKLTFYGILAVGVLIWGRLWLNRHDDKVAADAKAATVKVLEEQYVASWQQRLTEAKVMADTARDDRAVIEEKLDELDTRIAMIFNAVRDIKAASEKRQVIYAEKAAAVPPSQLDSALRTLSNDPAIKPVN